VALRIDGTDFKHVIQQRINPDRVPTRAVQGADHRSPLENQFVSIEGVVTLVSSHGLYLLGAPEGDVRTSDGILVFTLVVRPRRMVPVRLGIIEPLFKKLVARSWRQTWSRDLLDHLHLWHRPVFGNLGAGGARGPLWRR
jgi:hypothetical protein